jgi:hypothetical protein
MVRNFFYLDGPDYYFELKLTPTDRTRLIDYFRQHSHGEGFNQTADSAVPPSWHVGDTSEYEQHFLSDEQRGAAVMLSLDSSGERAWLVIYNF